MFGGSTDDHEARSWQIFSHVLNESNRDDYISRDFFTVRQATGGLPDGVTFEDFVTMVAGHVRAELGTFEDDLNDDDFKLEALTFDDSIRQHLDFLEGVVHRAAPGEVHLRLWNLIQDARHHEISIYALYRDR